jgi:hypothetical protein
MSNQILRLTIHRDQCSCVRQYKFADYTHLNRKLQLSHEYINLSKLELNIMIPAHRGHSVSMSSSDIGNSDCSV